MHCTSKGRPSRISFSSLYVYMFKKHMEHGKRQRPFNDIQKSLFYDFFFWGYCLFRKIETLLNFLEFCMETPTFPFY